MQLYSAHVRLCISLSPQAPPFVKMVAHVVLFKPAHAVLVTMETTASTQHVRQRKAFVTCSCLGLVSDLVPDLVPDLFLGMSLTVC